MKLTHGGSLMLSFVLTLAAARLNAAEPTVPKFSAPANDKPTLYGLTYGRPFIDIDEWRDKPRRHRYVHGGFEDSHLRFSVYLPPKELYKERFLLMLEGGQGGQDKMMAGNSLYAYNDTGEWDWLYNLAFDEMGAYLVETNEGHYPDESLGTDNPRDVWQASGYATSYVRNIAAQMYRSSKPERGYVNGCSGGGTRSSQHLENMPDLIDGAVAQAWGHLGALQWSSYALAGTLLRDKTKNVIDALDVGGSGDPYAGLDSQQADALKDFLTLGYIRDGVSQLKPGWVSAPAVMYIIKDNDLAYFSDFWTKPGFLGHDNPKELEQLRINTPVVVEKVFSVRELESIGAIPRRAPDVSYDSKRGDPKEFKQGATIKFDGDPRKLFQATATILSGKDKGRKMQIYMVGKNNLIQPFIARDGFAFDNVRPGDTLQINNDDYIAYMYYHRYVAAVTTKQLGLQTPERPVLLPELKALADAKGQPKYFQRDVPINKFQSADFKGKMIALSGTADEPIWPTSMTAYEKRVRKNLGSKYDDRFRLWFVENNPHCSAPLKGPRSTVFTPNTGITAQALLDVMKWVEEGVAPAASTGFRFSDDNGLVLAPTAKDRKGIQPVASITVAGNLRAEVPVGTPVKFTAIGEAPPGSGTLVRAQFDFDGQGTWPESVAAANGSSSKITASATYAYTKPGTYFPVFRVASHRDGAKGKGEPIYNLARMRVIVK